MLLPLSAVNSAKYVNNFPGRTVFPWERVIYLSISCGKIVLITTATLMDHGRLVAHKCSEYQHVINHIRRYSVYFLAVESTAEASSNVACSAQLDHHDVVVLFRYMSLTCHYTYFNL